MPAGKTLRVEVLAPAVVQWTTDGWVTGTASPTRANQVAIHLADVPTPPLPAGTVIGLSFYWPETETWEPTKFAVEIR